MYPILFQWGSFVLPSWHAFYVLGALAGYALLFFLARLSECSIAKEDLSQLFVVCYISGYFGARFLSIVVEEPHIAGLGGIAAALVRFGPMTFYGGAISAFFVGSAYCIFRKVPFTAVLDMGLLSGFLALGIGRIGCFLNGDDYGKPVPVDKDGRPLLWGVIFPVLDDRIPRWPVQLMESLAVFIMVGCLIVFYSKPQWRPRSGMVGFLCIVIYANLRFVLEFLRDDFRGFVFGTWLSTSQFIAILTLALAGTIAPFWLALTSKEAPSKQ